MCVIDRDADSVVINTAVTGAALDAVLRMLPDDSLRSGE